MDEVSKPPQLLERVGSLRRRQRWPRARKADACDTTSDEILMAVEEADIDDVWVANSGR